MSPQPTAEERAASRAEARRRARLASRGALPADEVVESQPETDVARRPSFIQRLFPPAPPLPGRPDPLAKFDRTRPLRPIRERLYLLARNPLAWMITSLACAVGYFAAETQGQSGIGLIGTFLNFGSLIAAGWFGWQRPALYGTVTALIGFVLVWSVVFATFAQQGVGPGAFGDPTNVLLFLAVRGVIQGVLGYLGGWYGGYLRRRQAQVSAEARTSAASRRKR